MRRLANGSLIEALPGGSRITLPSGAALAALAALVALSGPDNQTIFIAPQHIVSLRAPRATEHFAPGTRCILLTVDGRLVSVRDRCEDISRMIEK